jgi:type I restriction enzyme M protein
MLAPYKGRVFDPCCGSGGMFVQSVEFVKAHANGNGNGGKAKGDISIFGQESNPTTWRLARMNLAIRSIEGNLGLEPADSFHRDLHKDLKADYILANPPFNMSDWGGDRLREDIRWKFGVPSAGNANYAWVQHFLHHLAPTGMAGFVLANGALSATGPQGEIKSAVIEADLVDCIVMLPPKLFYATQAPVSLWFLCRNKASSQAKLRPRKRETLFIDARKCFEKADLTHNTLTDEHIELIARTYHTWRSRGQKGYKEIIGFCRSVQTELIAECDYSLVPARHVGINVDPPDPESTRQMLDTALQSITTSLHQMEKLAARVKESVLKAK